MPGLNEERFEDLLLSFGRRRVFESAGAIVNASFEGEEASEVELTCWFRLHRRPFKMLGKAAGGSVGNLVLVHRPSSKPSGCVQMKVSSPRPERLAFVEERIRQIQPRHTNLIAVWIPGHGADDRPARVDPLPTLSAGCFQSKDCRRQLTQRVVSQRPAATSEPSALHRWGLRLLRIAFTQQQEMVRFLQPRALASSHLCECLGLRVSQRQLI